MGDLHIRVDGQELDAAWLDTNDTTQAAVRGALPLEGAATRWGAELYMHISVDATPTDVQLVVPPGTLAYWPDGPAICLFWGPTPASTDEMPTAASPVAPIARVHDTSPLEQLSGGASMRIYANSS